MSTITTEYLYDTISDYFAFECEEDSWEKGQDLESWDREQLLAYYLEFLNSDVDEVCY